MRIRTIKPEYFQDEDVGLLSREARLLFIGTWGLADDEGLLRWTPAYIKAALFMYDDDLDEARVSEVMEELAESGFVLPYQEGRTRQRLAWIITFRKHQRINRPQPGRLPPPSIQNPDVIAAYCQRDEWRCSFCGGTIEKDPSKRGSSRKLQPSLDHIIPRSQGGSDYPSNIRLVHFACNASRRNSQRTVPSDYVRSSVNRSVNDSATLAEPVTAGTGNREQGKEGKGREGKRDTETPTESLAKPPKAAPEAKELALYLKSSLRERGVTLFPRDWHLRAAAVADEMLRAGVTAGDVRSCIDWALADDWWSTRVTRMEKVRDLMPQYQQIRNGYGQAKSEARRMWEEAERLERMGL